MNLQTTTAALSLLLLSPLLAESEIEGGPIEFDPITAAIETFNNRDRAENDEVLARLNSHAPDLKKPVLVTGKPPKDSKLIDISDVPIDPEAAEALPPADQPEAKGLKVRVEQLQKGKGKIIPESVRLLAPFPAKPLDEAPAGWLLESSNSAPAITRQVELAPGKAITLTIRPHVLVPDADKEQILQVAEPGFEASLGYNQSDTISAVLSNSIEKLDADSKRIGDAIDQLQQLIVSLPKPKPNPEGASSIPDAQNPIPEQP